jgi:hypothetical protein
MLRTAQQKFGNSTGPLQSTAITNPRSTALQEFKDDPEALELCCQTAVMGALSGMQAEVRTILRFLELVFPDRLKVMMTKAFCEMSFGKIAENAIWLRDVVVPKHPDSLFAQSYLNFAEVLAGKTTKVDTLRMVAESGSDVEKEFAEHALVTLKKSGYSIQ